MTAIAQKLTGLWDARARVDWLIVLMLSIVALVAVVAPDRLSAVLGAAGAALAQTMIYIAIAVGLLAYLKASGAETLVAEAFKGSTTRMIVLGALVGGLSPFCSCEVIPFIAGLLALGAPLSAVMAFWLSSPIMDPVQFTITTGVLGVEYAVAKTLAAVALGLFGGFAVRAMMQAGAFAEPLKAAEKRGCGCGPKPFSGAPVWRFWVEPERVERFKTTSIEQSVFLLRWLALAYLLEGVFIAFEWTESIAGVVSGEGFWTIVLSALVGMPAYLNGVAAPAMLQPFVEPGVASGGALAFMIAGGVSSIPAMAAVWSLVKPQVFAIYLAFGLIGAVAAGVVFQAVL